MYFFSGSSMELLLGNISDSCFIDREDESDESRYSSYKIVMDLGREGKGVRRKTFLIPTKMGSFCCALWCSAAWPAVETFLILILGCHVVQGM